jgi:hypothetical protein
MFLLKSKMVKSVKKAILVVVCLVASMTMSLAQNKSDLGFNYQAVARDNDGNPLANKQIVVEISIRKGSETGITLWQETHDVTTNEFGLFSLVIGRGNTTGVGKLSAFKDIDWTTLDYFTGVRADFGNGLLPMGNVQLQAVPYALAAGYALNAPKQKLKELADVTGANVTTNSILKWNGSAWIPVDFDGKLAEVYAKVKIDSTELRTLINNNMNLPQEILDRKAADLAITIKAVSDSTALRMLINNNQSSINLEKSTRESNEYIARLKQVSDSSALRELINKNTKDISTEVTDRKISDLTTKNKIAADSAYLRGLINTNNSGLEKEIQDRINGDNANASRTSALEAKAVTDSTAFKTLLDNTNADLATEITNRTNADNTIKAKAVSDSTVLNARINENRLDIQLTKDDLNTEIARATQAENNLTQALTSEMIQRAASESDIRTKVSNDSTLLRGLINTNTTGLATEVSNRIAAENTLTTDLQAEILNRQAADNLNTAAINTEKSRAQAAENTLNTDLASETTNRTAADNTIKAKAVSDSTALRGLINTNTTNITSNTTNITALETLADGKIYLGNASNVATEVTMSGHVTMNNAGVTTIANDAITSFKIADGSIYGPDVADGAIGDQQLTTGINANKLANGSVSNTEFQYLDGATSNIQTQISTNATNITTNATNITALETLADGKIYLGNASNVATEVTMSGHVTMNNAGVTTIANDAITSFKIADGSIYGPDVADGAIGDNHLTTGIDGAKLSDGTVTASKLAGLINGALISDGAIADNHLTTGIDGAKLSDGTVTTSKLAGSINGALISDGAIADNHIASGVDATKIADGTVSNAEFQYIGGLTSDAQAQINSKADLTLSNLSNASTARTNLGLAIGTDVQASDADLDDLADGSLTATKIAGGNVSNTEFDYLDGATSNIQTQISANATNITTNTTNITTNATNIATNATDIDAIETLADGKIYLGNGSNVATEVEIDGDVTMDNTGWTTISNNAITSFKIADGSIYGPDVADGAIGDQQLTTGINANKLANGSVSNTEFQYLDGATSNIQTQLNAKATATDVLKKDGSVDLTSDWTVSNNNVTLTNGTLTANNAVTTNDLTVGDSASIVGNANVGGTLNVGSYLTVTGADEDYGIYHTDGTTTIATYIDNQSGKIGTTNDIPFALYSNNNTLSPGLVVDQTNNQTFLSTDLRIKDDFNVNGTNGNITTSGKLASGTVTYPNAHGTNGQVLSTSGSGELTWSTISAADLTLSNLTNVSTARTNLGLAIGTDVQAYDADLTTYAGITPSANIQSLLGSANYSAARTNLGLAIGTDVQAYDADLDDLADGTLSASKIENGDYLISSAGTAGQVWTSDGSGAGTWASVAVSDASVTNAKIVDNTISSVKLATTSVSSSTTLTSSDYVVTVSGANTISLPSSPVNGQLYLIIGASATIDCNGKVMNGTDLPSFAMSDYGYTVVQLIYSSDLGKWVIISTQ